MQPAECTRISQSAILRDCGSEPMVVCSVARDVAGLPFFPLRLDRGDWMHRNPSGVPGRRSPGSETAR
jgi:hypothetical protein